MAPVNQNKCGFKLLDDKKLVPDSAFSASSSFELKHKADRKMDLSPKAARESYDKDNQEFAWCPKNKVSTHLNEYLEIDMGRLVVITFAQTRGRFAQGAGKEYIPFYKIRYRREDTEKWRRYKKFDTSMGFIDILNGPSDPFLDAYETLDPPIITRWIRIYPFSYNTMHVCMKLQLFGCNFESNLIEYRIPQGSEPKKSFINFPKIFPTVIKVFQDSSYDGSFEKGFLNGGLGRLTDNKTGGNFILNPAEAQHFVGWNANYLSLYGEKTLTLWFRFDCIRNFSYLKLNGYENISMNIASPAKIEAKFSLYGDIYSDSKVIISNVPVSKSSKSSEFSTSWSQFNLHQKIGKFIQLKLFFQSDWILLTEIDFISDKAVGFSNEYINILSTVKPSLDSSSNTENPQSHVNFNATIDVVYVLTILLSVLVVVIVVISILWLIMRHKRNKRKKVMKKNEVAFYSQNPFKTLSIFPNNQAGSHRASNSYIGQYTSGSLRLNPRPSVSSQKQSCNYNPNTYSQSCIIIPKQSIPVNDNSIYNSIHGSDNDSSLSNDYMASSGTNSSHPYAQTIPLSTPMAQYIISQPQIIKNPLVEYLDNDNVSRITQRKGLYSYDIDMLGAMNTSHISNSLNNFQSFSGSNGYQTNKNCVTADQVFYPLSNSYLSSTMRHEHL